MLSIERCSLDTLSSHIGEFRLALECAESVGVWKDVVFVECKLVNISTLENLPCRCFLIKPFCP